MKNFEIAALMSIIIACTACASTRSTASTNDDSGEPVEIGYDRVAKENLTYSVGHVKNKDTRVYNSIYDYFRDKVPGVRVENNGPRSASVYVRGINSINSSTQPLFIVDGTSVDDISNINPYEVDSVDVLKDASASIYGVRGANGVIIITLKKRNK